MNRRPLLVFLVIMDLSKQKVICDKIIFVGLF